jgi:tetratricopeptide (TPR) repeat protein
MQTSARHNGPTNRRTARAKADDCRKAKQFEDAVREYAQLWPDGDPWTGWGYALCLRKLGRSKEALDVARAIYALDPNFELGRSVYAWALFDLYIKAIDDPEPESLRAAQAIVRLAGTADTAYAPTSPLVVTVIKVAKLWAKRTRDIRALEWVEKLDPTRLPLIPGKGRDDQGREREIASPREQYYSIRTHALERLGRWQECLDACMLAVSECSQLHHDNDIWFARRIALAKQALGQPEQALSDLRQLAIRKPRGFMQTDIARAAWEAGDVDSTFKHALQALLAPDEIGFKLEAALLMAQVLWKRSEFDLARAHLSLCLAVRESKGWKVDQDLITLASNWDVNGPRRDLNGIVLELQQVWRGWSEELTPTQFGIVVKLLPHGRSGFIRSNAGDQFYFDTREWRQHGTRPAEGSQVKFRTRPGFDPKRNRPTTIACEIRPTPLDATSRRS